MGNTNGNSRQSAAGRGRNGEGGVYRRGGVWYARWTDADGVVHARSTGEGDEGAARRRLAEWVAPFRAGRRAEVLRQLAERVRQVEDERPPVRVADAPAAMLADARAARWAESVRRVAAGRLADWAAWMARERPRRELVRETTAADAAAYLEALRGRGRGGKTANDYRALLAQAWDWLAGDREGNPFRATRPAPRGSVERRPLATEELRALLDAAAARGPDWRRLLLVGLYAGLRLGDALALDWSRVDLAAGWITVRPHKTAGTSGVRVRIPIAAPLAAELGRTPADARRGPVCAEAASYAAAHEAGAQEPLEAIWRAAGVAAWERNAQGRRVSVAGFHALRHTFVSLAADAGVPLAVVQAIVGHGAEAMTRRYYHAGDAALRAAAAALPDVRAPGGRAAPRHEKASPANVAGLERMTDAELRALARAVRALLRARRAP